MYQSPIPYPYLPEGRVIVYVNLDDRFMARAKVLCDSHTNFCRQPTTAVIVRDGNIIGEGRNGGEHPPATCRRAGLGCKTGEGYELCAGCDPKNHAEQSAIRNAIVPVTDADLYLYGHWWCCKSCWQAMITAGIRNVYLVEGATEKF